MRVYNEEAAGVGLEPVSPITASPVRRPRDSPVPVISPRERRATGLMHLRLHRTPFISYGRFVHARARARLPLSPSPLSFLSLLATTPSWVPLALLRTNQRSFYPLFFWSILELP